MLNVLLASHFSDYSSFYFLSCGAKPFDFACSILRSLYSSLLALYCSFESLRVSTMVFFFVSSSVASLFQNENPFSILWKEYPIIPGGRKLCFLFPSPSFYFSDIDLFISILFLPLYLFFCYFGMYFQVFSISS